MIIERKELLILSIIFALALAMRLGAFCILYPADPSMNELRIED